MSKSHEIHRYRTLFLSDLHLGTRGCQAHLILDMLRHVEADTIYLVGDIIDGWRLRSGWYWPQTHNDVVQKLLRKVRRGARMVFVPGNHDEFARQFFGLTFGGIEIKRQAIHAAADGKRYLVIHGDEFDVVVRHSKWLAFFGDWAYDFALFVNTHFNAARRALGLPYWSFSAWAKLKVKNAVNFIGSFERELAAEAKKRGVDGVVCGHIHHPVIREMEGVIYVNTGDFVESCSLVVEHWDGRFEVLRWKTPSSSPRGSRTPSRLRTKQGTGERKRRKRKRPDAHPDRDRRLAAPSQRRRVDPGADDPGGGRIRGRI